MKKLLLLSLILTMSCASLKRPIMEVEGVIAKVERVSEIKGLYNITLEDGTEFPCSYFKANKGEKVKIYYSFNIRGNQNIVEGIKKVKE